MSLISRLRTFVLSPDLTNSCGRNFNFKIIFVGGMSRSRRHSSNESGRYKFLSDLPRRQICRDKSVIFVPLSEDLLAASKVTL